MTKTKNYLALMENHRRGKRPIVVLEGSSRSAKTYSAAEYVLNLSAQFPGLLSTVVRREAVTCSQTVVPTFLEVLANEQDLAARSQVRFVKSERAFVFPNGSRIAFLGCDEAQKLQGRRQHLAWCNEAMEIPHPAWVQLRIRTEILTILDYNPSLSSHWVFSELLNGRDDVLYVHSTFRDNPHLPQRVVDEILSLEPTDANRARGTANAFLWHVYGLGQRGRREGLVYSNWDPIHPKEWPERRTMQRHGYAIDFGFSQDPTAIVECAISNDMLYARLLAYETGMLVARSSSMPSAPSIEGVLEARGVDRRARIWADSAQPESIRQLALAGWNVMPAKKGAGSVLDGIGLLSQWYIRPSRDSLPLLIELENYCWAKDRATGAHLGRPVDEHNHALDAMRYWVMAEASNPRAFRPQTFRPQTRMSTPLDGRRW